MSSWQDILLALSTAGVGGGVLKMSEMWLNRSKTKGDQDKQFRDELRSESVTLRAEIESLKAELKNTEEEMDKWKIKYWDLYQQYAMFRIEISNILIRNGIDTAFLSNTIFPVEKREDVKETKDEDK